MRTVWFSSCLLVSSLAALIISGRTVYAADTVSFEKPYAKASYSIGYNFAKRFQTYGITLRADLVARGIADGAHGKKPLLSDAAMRKVMQNLQQQIMENKVNQHNAVATDNLKASAAFLQKIAKEDGVKKIATGLYYKVEKQGSGDKPKLTSTVKVNYEGSLIDGTVFDSSYKRNEPISFKLSQVIVGWQEALQLMSVGSTWMIYIAPELAYGDMAPASIGPNQALTFKVELLDIVH
ncbi:MAG: hypothetical protein COB50_04445 [Thiotrichales bacterium]|nr:MAG: hypothetical protein COB50_04445 [Thiotrichales bacterium]